eukprot:jgi/Chlat1/9178/Chrsp97S00713
MTPNFTMCLQTDAKATANGTTPGSKTNTKEAGSEQAASEIAKASIEDVLSRLGVTDKGLSSAQVEERLARFGPNALEEKSVHPVIQYLLFLWNPMSWTMEIAALLAIILGDWLDAVLVASLLLINATIGYWEEHTSGEAIAALKAGLAPNSRALRNGEWVSVDQASLTGESLPVTKYPSNTVFAGAVLKQGEVEAVVYATGVNTFFGKAADLVQSTVVRGHFQTVLTNIGATGREVILMAALAAGRVDPDAIDGAILGVCEDKDKFDNFELLKFEPFDPVGKRVIGIYKDKTTGQSFAACKGAPQIALGMAHNKGALAAEVEARINNLASRGYRTLGVCKAEDEPNFEHWRFIGLIPLFDPPRHDTAETVEKAQQLGIGVKMITGDQAAIAKETCRQLKMGDDIQSPDELLEYDDGDAAVKLRIGKAVELADGFAGVYPEHKYKIVEILQKRGHFVGMTGDGVNDAPALKKADIGIAVADATDAARAAADIVLMSPGLGVIIHAIIGARKIFQRMRNYAMYSVSTTIRNVTTFAILTIAWDWYFPTFMMALIAILNDGTILTVSTDRVLPSDLPDHWHLDRIFLLSVVLGGYLVISTLLLFAFAKNTTWPSDWFGLRDIKNSPTGPQVGESQEYVHRLGLDYLRSIVYLNISISGQLIIFSTRSTKFWFSSRPSYPLMGAFVIAQIVSTFIAVYGFGGYPNDGFTDFRGCGWGWALFVWIWSFLWFLPLDFFKLAVQGFYHRLDKKRSLVARENVPETQQGHPVYGKMETFQAGWTVTGKTILTVPDAQTVHSLGNSDSRTVTSLNEITYDGAGATATGGGRRLKDVTWPKLETTEQKPRGLKSIFNETPTDGPASAGPPDQGIEITPQAGTK